MIGDGRLAGKRNRDGLDRLIVVERFKDHCVKGVDDIDTGRGGARFAGGAGSSLAKHGRGQGQSFMENAGWAAQS